MQNVLKQNLSNVAVVSSESRPVKQNLYRRIIGLMQDRYFWYITVLAIFLSIFIYAPEITNLLGMATRPSWELAYYVALYRVTFILCITITSWRFGVAGGMVVWCILTPMVFSPFMFRLREPNILLEIGLVVFSVVVSFVIGRQGNLQKLLAKTAEELQQQALKLKLEIEERKRAEKEIRTLSLGAIESLVIALEAKDRYTAGHSRRVTDIVVAIGKRMDLTMDDLEDLRCSSLLHDVGKIAVEQYIQNKTSKLSSVEYDRMMIHVQAGVCIVKPVVNEKVVGLIEHHHDYYDGSGLRQIVSGEDIPLGARIIAVADAFDAMTSDRPYRSAMSVMEAVEEIQRCSGTQFDPIIVDTFLKILPSEIASVLK